MNFVMNHIIKQKQLIHGIVRVQMQSVSQIFADARLKYADKDVEYDCLLNSQHSSLGCDD